MKKTSLLDKSWREVTLVVLEWMGLFDVSPGSNPLEQQSRVQRALEESQARFGGVLLERAGTEVKICFGISQTIRHGHRALAFLLNLRKSFQSLAPLSFVAGVHRGQIILSQSHDHLITLLGPLLEDALTLIEDLPPLAIGVSQEVKKEGEKKFRFSPGSPWVLEDFAHRSSQNKKPPSRFQFDPANPPFLSRSDLESLFETDLLEVGLFSQEIDQWIHLSQGNPAVAQDLLAHWKTGPPCLTSRVREILLDRLEHLDREEQWIVRTASVVGEEGDISFLSLLLDVEEKWLKKELKGLQNKKIFLLEGKNFSFATQYIYQTTQDSLLKRKRKSLHKKILQLANIETEDPLFLLTHFKGAGQREEGLAFALSQAESLQKEARGHRAFWILENAEELFSPLTESEKETLEKKKKELLGG